MKAHRPENNLLSAVLISLAVASPAWAQSPDGRQTTSGGEGTALQEMTVDEIIVTAQKRSERINDVPLAIAALSGNQLQQQGVVETRDLARVVPSFNVQTSIYGNPVYYIRGVGYTDQTPTVAPAVSVYVDEVALPFLIMSRGAVLDLERVEVLKGPQGTLFGQNSTGGAVNYIAAKPTKTFAAGADLSYGRFNEVLASAFVSGPLSETLGIRVAVRTEHQDDWQKSFTRSDTRGQKEFYNGRMILDWQPSDRVKFTLSGQYWKDKSDTQALQYAYPTPQNTTPFGNQTALAALAVIPIQPKKTRIADWDPNSPTAKDNDFVQVALRGDIGLTDSINLTSITSYTDYDGYQPSDIDGTAYPFLFGDEYVKIKSFSQELRLAGDGDAFKWMVGGNFQHNKSTDFVDGVVKSSNATGYSGYDQFNNNPKINTIGIFGSAEYKLTHTLTARGSVRYTDTTIVNDNCGALDDGTGQLGAVFTFLFNLPAPIGAGQCVTLSSTTGLPTGTLRQRLEEDNLSWRVGLDWKVTPDTLLYVNVAKGYKAGGFTIVPAIFDSQVRPITQESLLAYETGLKTTLADNRVQLNLSAFYYDYRDKQLLGYLNVGPPFGSLPILVNVPKSRVIGLEGQIIAQPTELLRVQLSGAILDTKVQRDPTNPTAPLGGATTFIGESFPNTPKYQLNADIEQRLPLSDNAEGYIGGSLTYRSSASAAFGGDVPGRATALTPAETKAFFTLPSYALIDLRAGVRFDNGTKSIELWGRNITNKYYLNNVSPLETIVRMTGTPATYGVRFSWKM